jgi:glycogen debranching enzyme
MDFISNRLKNYPYNPESKLIEIGKDFESCFNLISQLPRHLIPKYFDWFFDLFWHKAVLPSLFSANNEFFSPFVCSYPLKFVQDLAFGSIQMYGIIPNTPLLSGTKIPSVAAGLPFFSNGFMRCWGRDTFISLRGLFLVTGRFKEARDILLGNF